MLRGEVGPRSVLLPSMLTKLKIPDTLHFAGLALERDPITRDLKFAPAPLAELCRCNGLDPVAILADEDQSCWLIAEWYVAHREAGGE
jgi:hypothetical protein